MELRDEIFHIVQSIWMSILNLSITVEPEGQVKDEVEAERSLTGCVQLTGDYDGAVLVYCTHTFAGQAAAIMFAAEAESLSVEDMQDALGELTNMIAGNIKPLLPGSSRLSLPSVVEGLDYKVIVPGSEIVHQLGFSTDGQPVVVTLVKKRKRDEG